MAYAREVKIILQISRKLIL